jgi:hypothetical protein
MYMETQTSRNFTDYRNSMLVNFADKIGEVIPKATVAQTEAPVNELRHMRSNTGNFDTLSPSVIGEQAEFNSVFVNSDEKDTFDFA